MISRIFLYKFLLPFMWILGVRRSDTKGKPFKENVESSNPCYSFNYMGGSNKIYIFEALIDMLLFITMNQADWKNHNYLSLCGSSGQAMLKY